MSRRLPATVRWKVFFVQMNFFHLDVEAEASVFVRPHLDQHQVVVRDDAVQLLSQTQDGRFVSHELKF